MNNQKIRKITILGAAGFIGQHLVRRLLQDGYHVKALLRESDLEENKIVSSENYEIICGDFLNEEDLRACLKDRDVCIHLVSSTLPQTSNADPIYDIESNLCGTIKMLDVARNCSVRKIIFASSGGTVYGTPEYLPLDEQHPTFPTCSYGITKLAIEKYLFMYEKLYGLQAIVLRVANPYGPGQKADRPQGVVAVFMNKIMNENPIHVWGDGSTTRDYIYIDDVIEAFMRGVEDDSVSGVFNVGSGVGMSVKDVILHIEAVSGKAAITFYDASRGFDVPANTLSYAKAAEELKWTPHIKFDLGVRMMWNALNPPSQ